MTRDQRRLAAIVSADVVGYSLLMGRDDSATLAGLKAHRRELIDPKIAEYDGRIVKTTGDGLLLEFPSVVDAVRCAVDIQRGMAERNAAVPPDQRIDFRIGINLGDIIIDGEDIFGDGVNVAARVQTLAEPGGICASKVVRDQVLDKLSFTFEDLGAQQVKNIARPVEVYRVDLGSEALTTQGSGRRRWQRLTRKVRWRWLTAGVVAIGIAGVALWAFPHLWKAAPAPSPPALSVAIMPLAAPNSDVGASRFAAALTRNLMTGLPRKLAQGRMLVVSGDSAAAGASRALDVRELGRRLNVRYVLEGDVLRGGDGNTVNLRLTDAATGGQLWSERNTLQDSEISTESSAKLRNLIERLSITLRRTEQQRVLGQPSASLSAPELVLRAWAVWSKDQSLAGSVEARKLVNDALRLDPNLVPALISWAELLLIEFDVNPNLDRDRTGRELDDLTARAVALDPVDPSAWAARSDALVFRWQWDVALDAIAMAIRLEPYEASHYLDQAWIMSLTAHPTEALAIVNHVLTLDPPSVAWAMRIACEAHLLAGQAEQAIAACEKAVGMGSFWMNKLFLAAAYANHGDLAKAAAAKDEVLRTAPGYTIAQLRAKHYSDNPEYLRLAETYWYDGLRKAGFPEQ